MNEPTDAYLDETRAQWQDVARRIWAFHEVALEEERSAALLAGVLEGEGFAVQRGVGDLRTAFVATAGAGEPVVGILAEYDALPALSQAAGAPRKLALERGAPGHGCGHNLLGTASVSAGIAANRARVAGPLPGTIKVFGTPAEEPLVGKTFMARDGAFEGVDALLAWHPDEENRVVNRTRLALGVLEAEFFGKTAHAAASPWLGRSALDALELLDHAIALMREHVLPTARMHRAIKAGGVVPNVIPDHARVQWFLRDATRASLDGMVERFRKAAEGAALATETRSEVTLVAQAREPVPNDTLGTVLQEQLERVGPPRWDEAEQEFARALQAQNGAPPAGLAAGIVPYGAHGATSSSDIGEASAVAPLAELGVVTRPAGTPSHHWIVTSCAGHGVGEKGMAVASKVLAASLVELLRRPAIVRAARAELAEATGGKPYRSPLARGAKPVAWY